MSQGSAGNEKGFWVDILKVTTTPLGFFVLIVLVIEGILSVVAVQSAGTDRTLVILGLIGTLVLLILVVAVLASRGKGILGSPEPPTPPPDSFNVDRFKGKLVERCKKVFGQLSLWERTETDRLRVAEVIAIV